MSLPVLLRPSNTEWAMLTSAFNFNASVDREFEELFECTRHSIEIAPEVEARQRNVLLDHFPERVGRKRILLAAAGALDDPSPELT
jgi:hypothetical protein